MQIKKTISQIALGLAVIGLGATTSAFTNKMTKRADGIYRYYNKSGVSDSSDLSNYEFHQDQDLCSDTPPTICSEEWDLGENATPPQDNDNPPAGATLVSGSEQEGSFTE